MSMKKFAIYTACIGGYDSIVQPEVIDERFDYILFVDDVKNSQIGVWQVRKVVYTNLDKTRIARYVKTHPEELLPEYEATLWLDANIQIVSQWVYNRVIDLYNSNCSIASICHPERDCIYDEAFTVASYTIFGALEHEKIALYWCRKLMKEHYPPHRGLYETNILYRKRSSLIHSVDSIWWESIEKYSKRDQLSFNYALWINEISDDAFFFPQGEHAQNSPKVIYIRHQSVSQRKNIQLSKFERLRYRYKVIHKSKARNLWLWMIQSHLPVNVVLAFETIISGWYVLYYKFTKIISR